MSAGRAALLRSTKGRGRTYHCGRERGTAPSVRAAYGTAPAPRCQGLRRHGAGRGQGAEAAVLGLRPPLPCCAGVAIIMGMHTGACIITHTVTRACTYIHNLSICRYSYRYLYRYLHISR